MLPPKINPPIKPVKNNSFTVKQSFLERRSIQLDRQIKKEESMNLPVAAKKKYKEFVESEIKRLEKRK